MNQNSKICNKTYPLELDEDFQPTGNKEQDENIKNNILARIGIPKREKFKQIEDEESTDSDEELSDRKYDILLDPECGYDCEKDVGWFDIVQSKAPWDESRRPYEQVMKYEDLSMTDPENEGILSRIVISTGLSIFDAIPLMNGHALTKLQLSDKGLKDIRVLETYKFLQYLDLSYNSISDLSPLQESTYLIVLDASHNELSTIQLNPTPWFLTYLNLSFNRFETVPDVSSMWSLKHLNLSNNKIQKIVGIRNLNYLEYLNMCHNCIEVIENISQVPLKTLDLSWNQIKLCVEPEDESGGLGNITTLQRLDLSHNQIESMYSINCFNPANLRHLNIAYNQFECVTSFDDLARFKALRYLRMEGNKLIHELPEIVKYVMHLLPQLSYINGMKLTKVERLIAYSMWNQDPIIHEMKKYCYDLLYSNVEPPGYGVETPIHLDYEVPIVILVGPNGSRKHMLAEYIARKYPYYVKTPQIHTTLYQYVKAEGISEEIQAKKFCHVSEVEFNHMWNKGKFLFVQSDLGDLYGVSREELEDDGRLLLIPLNIGPALSLTWQGLNTTLILVRPVDDTDYSTLVQKYVATILSIHEERDALKDLEEKIDKSKNDSEVGEEENEEEEEDEEQNAEDLPIGGPLGSSNRFPSTGKLRRSTSEVKNQSEAELGKSQSTSKSSEKLKPSRSLGKESDSKLFKLPSIDVDVHSLEYDFERDYPLWCDDESDDDDQEEEIVLSRYIPFIDTLKASQAEKENLWTLHDVYFAEKKTYYEDISEHLFTQNIVVEDLNLATKKILPVLIDKYNSRLAAQQNKKKGKDKLFNILVKPRLDEMMAILADRSVLGSNETGVERDTTDVSSSETRKETLSVPFFSKSTSSLIVTPSTSLTEFGTEEKQMEEPKHTWEIQQPPTPSSTSSSALEEMAKASMAEAGFDTTDLRKSIKYNKGVQM